MLGVQWRCHTPMLTLLDMEESGVTTLYKEGKEESGVATLRVHVLEESGVATIHLGK